ncbi:PQQ-dependent sugar dehydrogenase [Polymorphobacter sp.]|uniref:PQQ-dependent sugar dehydrogenase n=1 Tax=Polymorphobacter sp. TaxID=1909290 RepID=UPI003F6F74B0
MLALLIAAQVAAFNQAAPNAPDQKPAFAGQTRAPERAAGVKFKVETVVSGLESPWGMTFLPGGQMLVTEKPGRLRIVRKDGTLSPPVKGLPAVDPAGQGGLLDVALDPGFAKNGLIYWSYAERADGKNHSAVARGRLVDGAAPALEGVQRIFRQVPSMDSDKHYGSRLVFAPDGKLFITLGERSILAGRAQARQMDSLLGKVVRLNSDGSVPKDNPFVGKSGVRPEIWSSGHRNIQSAAIHPGTGLLWEVEHGARGGDEVNIVRKGRDYGWPTISYGREYSGGKIGEGRTAAPGMEQPVYYWDPIVAPSGMAFYTGALFPAWKGSLFVGGLKSTALVRLTLEGERVVGEERLLTELGARIRDVRQGPDGAVYVLTDGKQGRMLKLVPGN